MEVTGLEAALKRIDGMSKRVDFAVKTAVRKVGLLAEAEIKTTLVGTFNDGHKRSDGRYTDSPLGTPPMTRTGALRASVRPSQPKPEGFASYSIVVGPGVKYARALELGLSNGATYPFVTPASEKLTKSGRVQRLYAETLRAALRK